MPLPSSAILYAARHSTTTTKTRLLRQAIERNFEIIGEAIKRLSQHDPEIVARIGDHRQIIAFRNVLIHGYDLVDHALVWSTIEHQVPALLHDVGALLASAKGL